METFCAFMIFVCFFAKSSAYILSDSEAGRTTASTLVKEGLSAEIICMVEGTGYYFWRKGESFNNSTLVASSTGDNGNKDNKPYVVKVNGTLFIKKVTLKDEGKYFCRVTSVENECHGEVKVIVQASLRTFSLAIDRCDRESRCVLYLDPTQSISLTCTASNAPPSMTLKWFNGSKEITEGIIKNEIIRQKDNSRELTSRVSSVYGHPASLTCQAVDPKRSNDDVRFAHAQVEMTAMVNREQRKKYTKVKKEDDESLKNKVKTNEEEINAKHQELTEIKVSAESKTNELSKLKDELRKTKEELNKSKLENSELQKKNANNEAKITAAKESANTKDQEIRDKNQQLTNLKSKLPDQIQEMSTLKGNLESKEKSLAELEIKLKRRDEENLELQQRVANYDAKITAAEELANTKDQEIKNKNQELTDLKSKLPDQIQEMSTLKGDVQSKAKSIADLESNLKEKKNEIVNLQKELAKLKEDVQSRPKKITDLETQLRKRDEGIKEATNKVFKLQKALSSKERELNLAKQPKGAQQGSQRKPGKKRQGNDGD